MEDFRNFISIDPNIRFGKPCIINTRITVGDVLGWLAGGMAIDEILTDFPELSIESIRAVFAFAADRENSVKMLVSKINQA